MPGIVIVGSGLAGFNLVREIRRLDTKVPITMVSADSGDSYSKPMFCGAVSRKQTPDDLILASMESQSKYLGIKLHAHNAVEEILPDSKQLVCSRKVKLDYGRLVLATGSSSLFPPLVGNATAHAIGMNSLGDFRRWYDAISALPQGSLVAIIGGGTIAIEFASELVTLGMEPHLIIPEQLPLHDLVPSRISIEAQTSFAQCGIEFHTGCSVVAMDSLAKKKELSRRYLLSLSDGGLLEVGAVLVTIGNEPNIELANQAGLAVRRGVIVDRMLQTSHPDIFALGDVAEIEGHYLPYVAPLIGSAKVLAGNLTNRPTRLTLSQVMVQVKSVLHPMVACPPSLAHLKGEWEYEQDSKGTAAYLRNESGLLLGFVLTRERIQERFTLLASMEPIWPD